MKTKIVAFLTVALFVVGLFGTAVTAMAYDSEDPYVVRFIAGQHIDAGDVEVWNDETNLYVRIVGDGWLIMETHVAVAQNLDGIPQTKKGNPIPGKFEYKGTHDAVSEVTYTIPLGDLRCRIVIAVHAVVRGTGCYCGQEETAWARGCGCKGGEFPGKNWATYFKYRIQKDWRYRETVEVPANTLIPTESSTVLELGEQYKLVARGTANAGDTIDFDAKYSITHRIALDDWTDLVSGYTSYGPTLLDLFVDGAAPDWGAYNPTHEYSITIAGTGAVASFHIDDIYPQNNVGSLFVDIYEWA